jgi:hypothetical protein
MGTFPRLRPDYFAAGRRERDTAVSSLVRACLSAALAKLERTPAATYARRWDDRDVIDLILRAPSSPATVGPPLAHIVVALLDVLRPQSAGSDLLMRGMGFNFSGAAQINVPNIAIPTGGFVAEGQPIPVVTEPTSAGAQLTPHKLAVITWLTGEMARNANAEALIRQALIESAGPTIDKVLFSTAAATTAAPAGLLNGITGLTPASGTDKGQIIIDDVEALATSVAPVAGNGEIVLVASPDVAVALKLRLYGTVQWPVLTSGSLAAKTVIAVACNAVVSAVEGAPRIDVSQDSTLVPDTVPTEIVTAAGTVAQSVGSVFQKDAVALRLLWPITWALRDARGIAYMTAVNW